MTDEQIKKKTELVRQAYPTSSEIIELCSIVLRLIAERGSVPAESEKSKKISSLQNK